ncbi:MAG: hypothetical protein Q8N98_03270 [bacterium]|nr:hypothetical protein [bacterium]
MHDIQKILLKRLLTQNGQKYSSFTLGYNFEDNIVFHLKQLINNGLVKKNNHAYFITAEGVKTITRYDLTTTEDTGFKTFFIGFLCNSDARYLIKEHPFEHGNFYNLPSGKPRFGELIGKALVRTFKENTGAILKPRDFQYQSLHLKTIKTSSGNILFDDAFAIYKVNINGSQKKAMRLNKHIGWRGVEEIKSLANRWPEIDICILNRNKMPYFCYEVVSDYILN